jgi:hypothetical protein
MFLMATPGNLFWLDMLASVRQTASSDRFMDETGPGGLRRALERWVEVHGDGALVPFVTPRAHPDDQVTNNTVPWYGVANINERVATNATWRAPTTAPPEFRVGFVPNQLIDPGACKDHHCGQETCGHVWPWAYTVHHCLGSWKGRIDAS